MSTESPGSGMTSGKLRTRCWVNISSDSRINYAGKRYFLLSLHLLKHRKTSCFVHGLKINHKQHKTELYITTATTDKHLLEKLSQWCLQKTRETFLNGNTMRIICWVSAVHQVNQLVPWMWFLCWKDWCHCNVPLTLIHYMSPMTCCPGQSQRLSRASW